MRLALLSLCLLLSAAAFGQSKVIWSILWEQKQATLEYYDEYGPIYDLDEDPEGTRPEPPHRFSDWYVYPSVVRAVNVSRIEMYDELSYGLEEAVYLNGAAFTDAESNKLFTRIGKDLGEAGFDTWMEVTGANRAALYVKSDKDVITHFILQGNIEGKLMVLDYKGTLTVQQLMELRNMDLDTISADLLGGLSSYIDL